MIPQNSLLVEQYSYSTVSVVDDCQHSQQLTIYAFIGEEKDIFSAETNLS